MFGFGHLQSNRQPYDVIGDYERIEASQKFSIRFHALAWDVFGRSVAILSERSCTPLDESTSSADAAHFRTL